MKKIVLIIFLYLISTLVCVADNQEDTDSWRNLSVYNFIPDDTSRLYAMSHDQSETISDLVDNTTSKERIIEIIADDNFFIPDSITVNRGELIKFVVVNQGKLTHELVLGSKEDQVKHHELMNSLSVSELEHHRHDSVNSMSIQPGETRELVWTFDSDVQDLEFACHIPGHYEAGMTGLLNINENKN